MEALWISPPCLCITMISITIINELLIEVKYTYSRGHKVHKLRVQPKINSGLRPQSSGHHSDQDGRCFQKVTVSMLAPYNE